MLPSEKQKSIALIGARGAGKSRLSRKLGKKLARPVFSTDTQISFVADGKTVQQIVTEEGWAGFRQREYEILQQICNMDGAIIDCGGGILVEAPLQENEPETFSQRKAGLLKEHCIVIYLKRPMSWLLEKAEPSASRPDLGGESYEALLNRRMPWYEKSADVILDAKHLGTKNLIPMILSNPVLADFSTAHP